MSDEQLQFDRDESPCATDYDMSVLRAWLTDCMAHLDPAGQEKFIDTVRQEIRVIAPARSDNETRGLQVGDRVIYTYPERWEWPTPEDNGPGTVTNVRGSLAYNGPLKGPNKVKGRPMTSYTVAFDNGVTRSYAHIHGQRLCLRKVEVEG